tara:strand:- start:19 stop:576 length:558 start_codon:yes stop_codon:yes gene_type:complete
MKNKTYFKEKFRADKYGNLDRSGELDTRTSIDEFDKKTLDAVEASGTYGKLILATFDYIINKVITFVNNVFFAFFKDGYNMFKTDAELEEHKINIRDTRRAILKEGSVVIKYIYVRYLITLLVPPLGIFMSKGLYGWVNILISLLLMYVYYPLGVIYGLLLCVNSYYADLYEKTTYNEINTYSKD